MSLFDPLPDVFRGSYTSLLEWHAFCAETEMTVEQRLGDRKTWASQLRANRDRFNKLRVAHIGAIYIDTPTFVDLRRQLADILYLNWSKSGICDAIAIDSLEGNYGKSTLVARVLRDWDRVAREHGRRFPTPAGENNQHEPVIFTTCSDLPRASRGDEAILTFVDAPWTGLRVGQLPSIVKRHVLKLDTSVIVLDDVQELRRWRTSDEEMSGHLKYWMTLFPATIILIGWGMVTNKILVEGDDGYYRLDRGRPPQAGSAIGAAIASTSSTEGRITRLFVPGYNTDDEQGRLEMLQLLQGWENEVPLLRAHPGMLTANRTAALIWERTSGVLGSIERLLTRATGAAIRTKKELIDDDLLRSVRLDEAAELKRPHTREKLRAVEAELKTAKARLEDSR